MTKKGLIISASPCINSNSEALATAFADGARDAGREAGLVSLRGKTIDFCRGCFVCRKKQHCAIRDDGDEICRKALTANVPVFAAPIYYYELSGRLKTLLDRFNPLLPGNRAFTGAYLLSSAAEDEEYASRRAVSGVEGWVECFERARLSGTVSGAV